jgi:hypothetical protein
MTQAAAENILQRLARNAAQGKRKFISLYLAQGLRRAAQATWRNIFLMETVCRLEKDLALPDPALETPLPLTVEILSKEAHLTTWQGKDEILCLRGNYGIEQFRQRLSRGDVCFTADAAGKCAGFVWLEFPPGNEAGYPLLPYEAYTYDGWTFETFRGKRVLPFIQQAIMKYVRQHYPDVRRLVTHVALWNTPSLAGDQRAGYRPQRLEKTIMILGIHRKRILNREVPLELFLDLK